MCLYRSCALFPDRTACKLTAIPEKLDGLTVLDVGGYDGHMAKLCLERGARSATVVDNGQFKLYEGYNNSPVEGVEFIWADIIDYEINIIDKADVVLCFDVIYHSKVPYLLAEKLYELTKKYLCISSRIVPGDDSHWRLLAPREQHHNDPTVVWKPTISSLRKLLTIVGFKRPVECYREFPGTYEEDGLIVERWEK